ncbi:alpha/beta-hydrolase [Epithele typhae]|uniref:alpha/beta-hydrolase n=1 Tax=Epithele typhae TaxID=378194 RepID=UPI0020088448|nr:alpha/beta-hydrolase [Epithele typhae]KAH9913998.1 alpha/beta-hydrolase [Epithele typhae]
MRGWLFAGFFAGALAAISRMDTPSSFPHDYPGKPSGDFSPAWQTYFEVTEPLPGVNFALPRSFAGNVDVDRAGHPNNTLFFWAFERENGSLTASAGDRGDEPWGIWLNGGPGSSSMFGLRTKLAATLPSNGPIHLDQNQQPFKNDFSWDQLADYVWVDQPVGVGWSTTDSDGYVADEDQVGTDFMGFLSNLVKVFPSLATRPLYLTGESYAGRYIPYIMKAYFQMPNPPVKIAKFVIGDGSIGSGTLHTEAATLQIIQTYPQLINYDPGAYEFFAEQFHLCGFDVNLTYPQTGGYFPSFINQTPDAPATGISKYTSRANVKARAKRADPSRSGPQGAIDPWYGCYVWDEMVDYALNFSMPWVRADTRRAYRSTRSTTRSDPVPSHGSAFFNDPQARAAVHAPTSKNWRSSIFYPFLGDPERGRDHSEPMVFLTDLATNASAQGIQVVLYSGNDDSLVAHRGTEGAYSNTTFGGTQGFTQRPSTPWYDDSGALAGVVHQERNWTYVLILHAGHFVPQGAPAAAYVFLREFVLGANTTGLVASADGAALGGGDAALSAYAIRGADGIEVGSVTPTGTVTFASATVAAWDAFIGTVTGPAGAGTGAGTATGPATTHKATGGAMGGGGGAVGAAVLACAAAVLSGFAFM